MSTTHPEEADLLRLAHGEVSGSARTLLEVHLLACSPCRRVVTTLQAEEQALREQLAVLDVPVPRLSASDVASTSRIRARGRLYRLAASVLLTVTLGGVAWALPGSPVRRWVDRLLVRPVPSPVDAAPPVASAPAPAALSGVVVMPGTSYVVRLEGPPGGRVVVTLTDAATITAQATVGAATFTSEEASMRVRWADTAATVALAVPRAAGRVRVMAGSRQLLLKAGASIEAPAPDTEGRYILVLPR